RSPEVQQLHQEQLRDRPQRRSVRLGLDDVDNPLSPPAINDVSPPGRDEPPPLDPMSPTPACDLPAPCGPGSDGETWTTPWRWSSPSSSSSAWPGSCRLGVSS